MHFITAIPYPYRSRWGSGHDAFNGPLALLVSLAARTQYAREAQRKVVADRSSGRRGSLRSLHLAVEHRFNLLRHRCSRRRFQHLWQSQLILVLSTVSMIVALCAVNGLCDTILAPRCGLPMCGVQGMIAHCAGRVVGQIRQTSQISGPSWGNGLMTSWVGLPCALGSTSANKSSNRGFSCCRAISAHQPWPRPC